MVFHQLATPYRPRRPHGWQTIVNVGRWTSDSVKAYFGIGALWRGSENEDRVWRFRPD
jgi:hypothetical protein